MIMYGNKDSVGAGLVEGLCNTVMGILNCRLLAKIQSHDTFHGLRTGRGTKTASLEAKLLNQLTTIVEEIRYENFLDLHKVY